jgi:hypothetical protein
MFIRIRSDRTGADYVLLLIARTSHRHIANAMLAVYLIVCNVFHKLKKAEITKLFMNINVI